MIELFSAATPNGYKVSIALEEMGLPYQLRVLHLSKREQKEDWFLEINPNGRIPAIVDHGNGDFAVFESGAILVYLAERSGQLMGRDEKQRSQVMQWLMFQMGGLGPMMGQAAVLHSQKDEQHAAVTARFQAESRRLLEVMDRQLQDQAYLAGEYSIADIACWTWVRAYAWAGLSVEGLPHLQRWLAAIAERPAVQRGLQNPASGRAAQKTETKNDETTGAAPAPQGQAETSKA